MTTQEVKAILEETFKKLAKNNKISLEKRKEVLYEEFTRKLPAHALKQFDKEIKQGLKGTKEKVTLSFVESGPDGMANYKHNHIWINVPALMEKVIQTDKTFETIYKKELKFIQRNVKTKEDMLKWIMTHEFQHTLRYDKVDHTNSFFQDVETLYQTL